MNHIRIYVNYLLDNLIINDQVEKNITTLLSLLNIKNVNDFLLNPLVKKSSKNDLLDLIENELQIHPLIIKTIKYLVSNRQEKFIVKILDEVKIKIYEKQGYKHLHITYAENHSQAEYEIVENYLKKILECEKLHITSNINNDLIKGLIVNDQNKILDLSLQSRLKIINKIVKKEAQNIDQLINTH